MFLSCFLFIFVVSLIHLLVASKVQTGVAGSLIVEVEFSLVRVSNANKLTALPRLCTWL